MIEILFKAFLLWLPVGVAAFIGLRWTDRNKERIEADERLRGKAYLLFQAFVYLWMGAVLAYIIWSD